MFILGTVIGINIIGLIAIFILSTQGGYWDTLIYPALDRFLWNFDLSRKMRKVIVIIFTIVFLPALIIYFTILTIWILIIALIITIIERLKKKEN